MNSDSYFPPRRAGVIRTFPLSSPSNPFHAMRFFDWIARFAIVLFIAGCAGEKSQQQVSIPKKPNIIFIMADDLGIGDVGAYGQDRIRTPHIDRMAREGILFRHAYAGSTVCAPSRSVVMTGQHTGRTPIRGNKEVYPMGDRKSTRLNSSHVKISYAVFCL